MKINSKALLDAAALPMRLANKRNPLPVLNCLRLAATGGRLSVVGSNLDMFAEALLDCDGDLEPVCVSAAVLGKLLNAMGETVELTVKKQRLCVLGKYRTEIAFQAGEEMPPFPECVGPDLGINARDLAAAIHGVDFCCHPGQEEQIMRCVWVHITPKSLETGASDRRQGAYVHVPVVAVEAEWLLPAEHAHVLADVLELDGATVNPHGGFVFAKHPHGRVAVKRAEGHYPRIKQAVAKDAKLGDLEIKPLKDALALACSLPGVGEFAAVTLAFSKAGLDLERREPMAEFETRIPGNYAPASVKLDGARLLNILNHCSQPKVQIYTTPYNGLFIQSGDVSLALAGLKDRK
jgi:DNA polymerase III sliding clamp (beta) subunit (PCNA family)